MIVLGIVIGILSNAGMKGRTRDLACAVEPLLPSERARQAHAEDRCQPITAMLDELWLTRLRQQTGASAAIQLSASPGGQVGSTSTVA
jgi:hypothetical protein